MQTEQSVALVSGAGGGIGRAICRRLGSQGITVAVTDIDRKRADRVANEINTAGGNAHALKADVTKTAEVRMAVEKTITLCGRVDMLINNAGGSAALIGKLSHFSESHEEVWKWVIDLNLHGTMRFTQAVIKQMIEQNYGRIVNIASIAAERGIVNRVDYSAAKGAVVSMTRALAMEVGGNNITVNCVSPGLIQHDGESVPHAGTYLGRTGTQSEVAELVSFLVSSEADFVTGQNYTIDGGRTLGPGGK